MSATEPTVGPVPTYYTVTVKFSDEEEPTVEKWYKKEYADHAVESWKRIEKVDRRRYGSTYHIESITVTPGYGYPEGYVFGFERTRQYD